MHPMMNTMADAVLQLLFPRTCPGCGTDLHRSDSFLCTVCLLELPETGFSAIPGNPVERKFWGRLAVTAATAVYHFRSGGLMQHLMHRFKYGSDQDLCVSLGRLMGATLSECDRFRPDLLVPLPLHPHRERTRGYNQARLLCDGMSQQLRIPVAGDCITRTSDTGTQTAMSRTERWLNMQGKFSVRQPAVLENRSILLVDDVVTTGATLEACGLEMITIPGITISIAALCYASQV
jgi:ComF family protein